MKLPSILIALTTAAYSQGSLTPPGAPAPTQKSLQEIWDELRSVKDTATAQGAAITSLKTQLNAVSLLGATSAAGQALPWQITTVDSIGQIGSDTSLAFGPDGQPAICYLDGGNGNLKFARFNGTAWAISTVDSVGDVGADTSLAFGPDGQPAISYYDFGADDLKFARFNGTTWTVTTVDSAGEVGKDTSLSFGPDGQPAISYYDETNRDLKFARFNGTAWILTTVDSVGNVGQSTSLAFSPSGQPSISYTNDDGDLKFTRFDGIAWIRTIVDADVDARGSKTSLAFGPNGQPAISFHNNFIDLGFARYNGTEWILSTAEIGLGADGKTAGEFNSLAFGPDGQPAISHYEFSEDIDGEFLGDLKFARFNGATWTSIPLDIPGNVGTYTSLAFGPDGQPAISYYDSTNGDLKFARKGLFKPAP